MIALAAPAAVAGPRLRSAAARMFRRLRPLPWLTLAVVGCALLAHVALPSPLALAYAPKAPAWLQLLGCHFVHFADLHLTWDTLSFGVLGCISERMHRRQYAAFLGLAILVTPPLAGLLTPWLQNYAGLSGLVIGQVALALARALLGAAARGKTTACGVLLSLLALLFAKQLYELQTGTTSLLALQYRGFATVPAAHLVSAWVGALVGLASPPMPLASHHVQTRARSHASDITPNAP